MKGLQFFMTSKNFELPKFLPTVTVSSLDEAESLCKILKLAKINSLEITLRSSVSSEAIEFISMDNEINLGIGTVLKTEQLIELENKKINFVVSPGYSDAVASYTRENKIIYIPGVETSTEIIKAYENGYKLLKFFPAELSGGIEKLNAIYSVFPDIKFLCTGGINLSNYQEYIKLPNVCALGGSFVLPKKLINEADSMEAINYLNSLI